MTAADEHEIHQYEAEMHRLKGSCTTYRSGPTISKMTASFISPSLASGPRLIRANPALTPADTSTKRAVQTSRVSVRSITLAASIANCATKCCASGPSRAASTGLYGEQPELPHVDNVPMPAPTHLDE
jgi:hypothetical protein